MRIVSGLSVWATVPLSQPSQDPVEQAVIGAWEGVVKGPFCSEGPTQCLCSFNWKRITNIPIACLLPIMVPQSAGFHSILKQCDTFWLVDTSLKPYLTKSLWKKRLESTLVSMRLAYSKRDSGKNWQPYFSCPVVLIKCLSYPCRIFFLCGHAGHCKCHKT